MLVKYLDFISVTLKRWAYVEVRNNIDVGGANIWRKQRGWELGKDEQMGGRKAVSKVEGKEKLFCQTHSYLHTHERLFLRGAWVPADGSCTTGDGVKGKKTTTLLYCLFVLLAPCCTRLSSRLRELDDAPPSGSARFGARKELLLHPNDPLN